MNLVQKLPIGLGLACVIMLSSCSKEDVVAPGENSLQEVDNSELREGGGMIVLPKFPSTLGATGLNTFPAGWQRLLGIFSSDSQTYPIGTSNLTHLWGDQASPWIVPLPSLPSQQGAPSFVTVTTAAAGPFNTDKQAAAQTKIKNLKPGKKYTISFYMATTVPQAANPSGYENAYAAGIVVRTGYQGGTEDFTSTYHDMSNKKATWILETVTFKALATETDFSFLALAPQGGKYSYAHVYVDKNSIREVN